MNTEIGAPDYNMKDLVAGMATVEGKKMKDVAKDLQCTASVLSNILSRRFSARDKEELLAERTRLAMYDLFHAVLGELKPSHKQKIDEFVKNSLDDLRNIKPSA